MSTQEKVNNAMAAAQGGAAASQVPATNKAKTTVADRVKATGNLSGLKQNEIGEFLGLYKGQIAKGIANKLDPERLIQMATSTIYKNPAIAKCTPQTLIGAVMQASLLGFPPVDALGYCYMVPYGKDVQFQIGYRGYIELARRSGQIKMVYAEVVRSGDEFSCEFGLEPKLIHKPKLDSSKPLTHAYAVAHFTDGGHNFVVLSKSDIERLRMRSPMQKGSPSGPWATDYDAMAKAKALKQLSKYLPLNIDTQSAIATDEAIIKPENFDKGEARVEEITFEYVNEDTGEIGAQETKEATESNEKK